MIARSSSLSPSLSSLPLCKNLNVAHYSKCIKGIIGLAIQIISISWVIIETNLRSLYAKQSVLISQLANYALEKKVRESERQEKIQANEREQHIRQVSRFESQFNQLDILMKQLTSKQDQLDIDSE